MQNFIFISPNFPTNYWQFCRELKNDGMNVLGIGDQPYDELKPELKDSLNEYYKVGSLENYDEVYRAVAFFIFKYGRIDWLESNNEYWLERDARLRTDFNITTGFQASDIPHIKYKSKMKEYYKKAGIAADVHPVQRLDKGTSGLLVVAKHPHAQEQLKGQLHTPAFRRIYLAVCEGIPRPPEGCIDAPIGRVPGSLMARQVDPAGQPASTRYRVLRTGQGRALVELELDTGRTHQIRVHMAHIGHPLTGDFLYGTEDHSLISRPALHSARLSLRHPVTGEPMAWEQPLPEDMARLV